MTLPGSKPCVEGQELSAEEKAEFLQTALNDADKEIAELTQLVRALQSEVSRCYGLLGLELGNPV